MNVEEAVSKKEVAGAERRSFKELVGYTIAEVEKWEEIGEQDKWTAEAGKHRGLVDGLEYRGEMRQHPENPMSAIVLMYVVKGDKERLERVALVGLGVFGWQLFAVIDWYENTDEWYVFESSAFDEQYGAPSLEQEESQRDRQKRGGY